MGKWKTVVRSNAGPHMLFGIQLGDDESTFKHASSIPLEVLNGLPAEVAKQRIEECQESADRLAYKENLKIEQTSLLWGRPGRFIFVKRKFWTDGYNSKRHHSLAFSNLTPKRADVEAGSFRAERIEFRFDDNQSPYTLPMRPFPKDRRNIWDACEKWLLKMELKGPPESEGSKPKNPVMAKKSKAPKV